MICPICGSGAAIQPTYKHRWVCCAACGCLRCLPRAVLPAEHLPAVLQRRLPRGLLRDTAFARDPQGAYFGRAAQDTAVWAWEADRVQAELSALGLSTARPALDIGGGPGVVAEKLGNTVLLEYARPALEQARVRGVDARFFDFQGIPIQTVVMGKFALMLCRFALGWCLDLPRLAAGLTAIAAPGAALVLWLLRPGRGPLLTCALDDHGPMTLWSPGWVVRVFAAQGWRLAAQTVPLAPMPFWQPRGQRYRLFSQPWLWLPGPLAPERLQHHLGLVLRWEGHA